MKQVLIYAAFAVSIACNLVGAYFIAERYFADKRKIPFVKTKVIFLGDSRIAEVNWRKGLHRLDVINAGVPGITSTFVRNRMDSLLKDHTPDYAVIQIGINDIRNETSVDSIVNNFSAIVGYLKGKSIKPILTSTIPVRKDFSQDNVPETVMNTRVMELNARLQEMAIFQSIQYIDFSGHVNPDGRLKRELTHDGIHLNPEGRNLLCQAIHEVLI